MALRGEGLSTAADFDIAAGAADCLRLSYGLSHQASPAAIDCESALEETLEFWREWSARCTYTGKRRDIVIRSLLTLKAMTFAETGGDRRRADHLAARNSSAARATGTTAIAGFAMPR